MPHSSRKDTNSTYSRDKYKNPKARWHWNTREKREKPELTVLMHSAEKGGLCVNEEKIYTKPGCFRQNQKNWSGDNPSRKPQGEGLSLYAFSFCIFQSSFPTRPSQSHCCVSLRRVVCTAVEGHWIKLNCQPLKCMPIETRGSKKN